VTAIWRNEGGGWRIVSPLGFPDEATLHTLVSEAPELLPLAGSPSVTVLGREVQLGSGYADLLAVEATGRLIVVEVKLARNSEARRAVVAQVLTYAAYLKGMSVAELEKGPLSTALRQHSHSTIADAVAANDQANAFDRASFGDALNQSLRTGAFRLVVVLDEAPPELARLVSYLEAVADNLLIDLVTVSSYEIGGSQVLVPQRVEGEPESKAGAAGTKSTAAAIKSKAARGDLSDGAAAFAATIETGPDKARSNAKRLHDWAVELERAGLAHLHTYRGVSQTALLIYVGGEQAGLVTGWANGGLSTWRSVFTRRAPLSIASVEKAIAPARLGQGTVVPVTDEVLVAVRAAYAEAAGLQSTSR
jgi:hypothetical protein